MSSASPQGPRLRKAAEQLRSASPVAPEIGMVLGSGLGAFADALENPARIPYADISGMPVPLVQGHAGRLILGGIGGKNVAVLSGRVHLYEGHPPCDVVFGVRLLVALGCKTIVLTNAAGGIGAHLGVADLMLITDHINMTGQSCLVGANEDDLGPRFLDMTTAYDPGLCALAQQAAQSLGFEAKRGVYAGLLGPTYETPAEIRMLRTLGADAVGMSTVLETIAARHMGARVLGISCITNLAAGLGAETLDHREVERTAGLVRDRFVALLRATTERIE